MPRATALLLAFTAGCPAAFAEDGPGQAEQFEEKAIRRATERAIKSAEGEGSRWVKELAKAYPGKVGPARTEEECAAWFDLLAANGREWRRDTCPSREITELFDRAAARLELGPVPTIRRDEFLRFAKHALIPRDSEKSKPGDRYADADRVFRVLDRDGSGVLEVAEWTDRLRADKQADADGNRRIDPDEFRAYFDRRVGEAVEAASRPKDAPAGKPGAGETGTAKGPAIPAWFKDLDTDGDGQVGLYEWRAAGRPVAEFLAMDLNGDGLLPPEEYLRYLRSSGAEQPPAESARPGPTPGPDRSGDGKKARKWERPPG